MISGLYRLLIIFFSIKISKIRINMLKEIPNIKKNKKLIKEKKDNYYYNNNL